MKVLIVDDDPLVSGALKVILESESDIEVCGVASGGAEAISRAASDNPDVIVMDIRMDGINGIEAAKKILADQALGLGASGYILKQDCATLASSVRAVFGGQIVFGGKIVEKLPDLMNRKEQFDYEQFGITDKEREMIEMVAEGLSNKEISEKMFLGEGTVRNMMSSVLSKLDLRDRTQLACYYYQKIKP